MAVESLLSGTLLRQIILEEFSGKGYNLEHLCNVPKALGSIPTTERTCMHAGV